MLGEGPREGETRWREEVGEKQLPGKAGGALLKISIYFFKDSRPSLNSPPMTVNFIFSPAHPSHTPTKDLLSSFLYCIFTFFFFFFLQWFSGNANRFTAPKPFWGPSFSPKLFYFTEVYHFNDAGGGGLCSSEVTHIHCETLWETPGTQARHHRAAGTLLFRDLLCETLPLAWT